MSYHVEIADARIANFSSVDQRGEGAERFLHGYIAAPVQQIEVDRSEAPQVMLARIGCSGPRRIVGEDLADQEQLASASGDRFATSALAPLSAYISAVSTSVVSRSKPARSAAASSFRRRASSAIPMFPGQAKVSPRPMATSPYGRHVPNR
jgi:hypothetical protein